MKVQADDSNTAEKYIYTFYVALYIKRFHLVLLALEECSGRVSA